MRRPALVFTIIASVLSGGLSMTANAAEEAAHTVIVSDGAIELRRYDPMIVAEVSVTGSRDSAGNRAFQPLFQYISGANVDRSAIDMTTPVTRERGTKIAMTAPVTQEAGEDGSWRVAFVMPREWTMETLPAPVNPAITLRTVPGRDIAAIRFSGYARVTNEDAAEEALREWLRSRDYTVVGEPVYAGYDAPFVPGPFRRNEVLLEVQRLQLTPGDDRAENASVMQE
jgi:hypothetical protein